ncbi:hypothetical protein J2T60_001213 [Natronospira proteinivora]|uniref:Uncharacterized protein n=1 Tax=Natronospira proteinivora TaxID=1807133 RepID=A0ABT1GAB6_9GAMM|nr:hypothetical protein [Natronospira proteinivora]MCP1727248.1 hypothetical protein [Natronospira proteinivora]
MRHQTASNPHSVALLLFLLPIVACNNSDSNNNSPGETTEPVTLSAESNFSEVLLRWDGDSREDIFFSTDRHCDWDNTLLCPDGGIVTDAGPGETILTADSDLVRDRSYFFVTGGNGTYSQPVGARPFAINTDRTINEVSHYDNTLYLLGDFTQISPATGGMSIVSRDDGRPKGAMIPVLRENENGNNSLASILHAAPMLDGSWLVRGDATHVGDQGVNQVFRVFRDGTAQQLDPNGFETNSHFSKLRAHPDQDLIVASGSFRTGPEIGAETHSLILINPVSGDKIDHFDSLPGRASTFSIHQNNLAVAGSLEDALLDNFVSIYDISTRSPVSPDWTPIFDGTIRSVALNDERLYVVGDFRNVDGRPRAGVAAFDANTLELLETPFDTSGLNNQTVTNQNFTLLCCSDGAPAPEDRVLVLDRSTDQIFNWNPRLAEDSEIHRIIKQPGRIYLTGNLRLEDDATPRKAVAYDGDSLELIESWSPVAGANISTISDAGDRTLIGGTFELSGGVARPGLAAIDMQSGQPTDWNPPLASLGRPINIEATTDSVITAFEDRLDIPSPAWPPSRIVPLDPDTGQETGAWSLETYNGILTLKAEQDTLYVGGRFTYLGEEERHGLGSIDLTTGTVTPWAPNVAGYPVSIAVGPETVYAGMGWGYRSDRLVEAIDRHNGENLNWRPGLSGFISNVLIYEDSLIVDGHDPEDISNLGINSLSRSTGEVTGFTSLTGRTHALTLIDDEVVTQGMYSPADQDSGASLRYLNAETLEVTPNVLPTVHNFQGDVDIEAFGRFLVTTGTFRTDGNIPRQGLLIFDRESGELAF